MTPKDSSAYEALVTAALDISENHLTGKDAALSYARAGVPVHPLYGLLDDGRCECFARNEPDHKAGKHPRTLHGFKDASADVAQVEMWWSMWPRSNIGASPPGLGLDVDPEAGGDESLRDLEQRIGRLPETLTQATGRRGKHYQFELDDVSGLQGAGDIAPGLDIRVRGYGYLVMPGSAGVVCDYAFDVVTEIAPAPAALVAAIRTAKKKDRVSERTPTGDGDRIADHTRNTTLTSLAGTMRRRGMTEPAIEAALLAENAERCAPPLDDDEVRDIAHSVGRYEPAASASHPVDAS